MVSLFVDTVKSVSIKLALLYSKDETSNYYYQNELLLLSLVKKSISILFHYDREGGGVHKLDEGDNINYKFWYARLKKIKAFLG